MLRLLILTLIASVLLSSCSRQYPCTNAADYVFQFYTNPGSDSISDTSATVVEYIKNTGFGTPVDTFPKLHFYSSIAFSNYIIPKGAVSEYLYQYDRIITLYPSGRTYKMRNVMHNSRTVKGANSDPIGCTNDVYYVVNDSQYHVAGEQQYGSVGGDAVMPIKY